MGSEDVQLAMVLLAGAAGFIWISASFSLGALGLCLFANALLRPKAKRREPTKGAFALALLANLLGLSGLCLLIDQLTGLNRWLVGISDIQTADLFWALLITLLSWWPFPALKILGDIRAGHIRPIRWPDPYGGGRDRRAREKTHTASPGRLASIKTSMGDLHKSLRREDVDSSYSSEWKSAWKKEEYRELLEGLAGAFPVLELTVTGYQQTIEFRDGTAVPEDHFVGHFNDGVSRIDGSFEAIASAEPSVVRFISRPGELRGSAVPLLHVSLRLPNADHVALLREGLRGPLVRGDYAFLDLTLHSLADVGEEMEQMGEYGSSSSLPVASICFRATVGNFD